jgi:hypothetical protein
LTSAAKSCCGHHQRYGGIVELRHSTNSADKSVQTTDSQDTRCTCRPAFSLNTTKNPFFCNMRPMPFLLILWWTLSSFSWAQTNSSNATWSGCVDPNNPGALVTIGQKTTVCLQIGNSENWGAGVEYIRLSFQPQGDEYSRFHVPNCT